MSDGETWDPEPGEREWYRDVISGQRGWRVIRNGQPRIRIDGYASINKEGKTVAQDITKKFNPGEWVPDNEKRPMTRAQIGQICFEADKKLCFFLGLKENSSKQWNDLHEEKRRDWIETGPTVHPVRKAMGEAIRAALAGELE